MLIPCVILVVSLLFPMFSWVWLSALDWSFPSSIVYEFIFVDRNSLNLVVSWNILFYPPTVIKSFGRYSSSLDWHLWSFWLYMISAKTPGFQSLFQKLDVILIGLHLYITWPFPLTAFNILSLFCASGVLIVMWQEQFLF